MKCKPHGNNSYACKAVRTAQVHKVDWQRGKSAAFKHLRRFLPAYSYFLAGKPRGIGKAQLVFVSHNVAQYTG